MDLGPYVENIHRQLAVAAEAGGDDARALADRLIAPLDAAVRLTLQDVPVTARALGDADVLAARSLLRMLFIARDAIVADEARAALALDRTNLLARLITTELTHTISADDARATAAAHPDDWRAWWLVELAHGDGAEVADAHQRLCDLAENSAPRCSKAAREAVPQF